MTSMMSIDVPVPPDTKRVVVLEVDRPQVERLERYLAKRPSAKDTIGKRLEGLLASILEELGA